MGLIPSSLKRSLIPRMEDEKAINAKREMEEAEARPNLIRYAA